jgi:hypothetical protein
MVFAEPSGKFYRDRTTSFHLPGFVHLDSFNWIKKPSAIYRDCAKTHASPMRTAPN